MNINDATRLEEILSHDALPFVAVKAPRELDAPIRSSQVLIDSVCTEEPVSFEFHGEKGQVQFGIRGADVAGIQSQLESHYPQAELSIHAVDPLEVREGETVHTAVLKVKGPEPLPLETFSDVEVSSEGADPLLGVWGNLGAVPEGVRILVRTLASRKPSDWARKHKRAAQSGAGGANVELREQERQHSNQASGNTNPASSFMLVIAVVAILAAVSYNSFPDQTKWAWTFLSGLNQLQLVLVLLPAIAVVGAPILGLYLLVRKVLSSPTRDTSYHEPSLVAKRVNGSGYDIEIQILVFTRYDLPGTTTSRPGDFVNALLGLCRTFDCAQGSRIVLHDQFSGLPEDIMRFNFRKRRLWFGRNRVQSLVGQHEMAGLWHLPSTNNNAPFIEKANMKRLPLPGDVLTRGAPFGVTMVGDRRLVRLNEAALSNHCFLAAGTGMGKTTAIIHILRHAMQQKADGADDTGIVVIDPHSSMIHDLLGHVPPEIAHRVRLIDLDSKSHAPGINILSPQIAPFRGPAAECLVQIARSQWPEWGSRMEGILRNAYHALHIANSDPSVAPENAFTLDDINRLIHYREFRQDVLKLVDDDAALTWWNRDFMNLLRGDRSQVLGPITNRLSAYESSETARVIFGQPFSTIDLRKSIQAGDIVFIDTAAGRVGDDVAALVGSFIMMMVDEIIRSRPENSMEHPHTIVVADEMQTLRGVDFGKSLSEWRKFRGSLILATQTLAALRTRSDDLVESILANTGTLAVFNVSAADARNLVPNLGSRLIEPYDATVLPRYHSYVRLQLDGVTPTTFSMKLLPPPPGRAKIRDEIRRRSVRYSQNREVVRRRLDLKYRKEMGLVNR